MNKQLIAAILALLSAISGITYYTIKDSNSPASAATPSDSEIYKQWLSWKTKFGKVYTHNEAPLKYSAFANTYRLVVSTNAKNLKYKLGLNQFSDLTNQEFAALQKGQLILSGRHERQEVVLPETSLPASVDWVTKGAVTPIKNQQQCGSCWSFSTTGGLEGLNFLKNGNLLSFSEQQLVDCSQSEGNQGCNGGYPDWAYNYTSTKGIELESTYPYTAEDGTCKYKAADVKFKNTGYADVTVNSPTQLQAAVAQQPTSVLIEADQDVFQSYASGILDSAECYAESQIDHAVLAVGYNKKGADNYWIVKNSWGTSWGQEGYVWIYFDPTQKTAGICGINSGPSYPK